MKNAAAPIIVGIIVLIIGIYLINNLNSPNLETKKSALVEDTGNLEANVPEEENPDNNIKININNENSDKKTFILTGENFKFVMDGVDNPEIKVKEGDQVRIEFSSTDGFHDWVVDEFNAATERVNTGGSTFIEFIASKKGTFEYYCSVGKHRENGMRGNLIVE